MELFQPTDDMVLYRCDNEGVLLCTMVSMERFGRLLCLRTLSDRDEKLVSVVKIHGSQA